MMMARFGIELIKLSMIESKWSIRYSLVTEDTVAYVRGNARTQEAAAVESSLMTG